MPEPKEIIRSRYSGLRDFYVAPITANNESTYTTGTPVKLSRAIKAKVADKYVVETNYSDDGVEDTTSTYQGTEVELEVSSLAAQDRALLMGHLYEKGYLTKSAEDQAPELALGFRAKRLNGKYDFVWLYCGKFAEGMEDNYETEGKERKGQTNTVKGLFYQRNKIDKQNGKDVRHYEIVVDEGNLAEGDTDAAKAITNWFSKVQERSAALPAVVKEKQVSHA